jgi:hypothetical protein
MWHMDCDSALCTYKLRLLRSMSFALVWSNPRQKEYLTMTVTIVRNVGLVSIICAFDFTLIRIMFVVNDERMWLYIVGKERILFKN